MAETGASNRDDGSRRSAAEWLRFPGVTLANISQTVEIDCADQDLLREVEEDAEYAPYLARQDAELRDLKASEALPLGANFPYATVPGLSNEMIEKLADARPDTLAAASRIRGITPAALATLLVHAKRMAKQAA